MKKLPIILIFIVIFFLIIFNVVFFGLKFAPDKVGLMVNTEKNISLFIPLEAEISEGNIQMTSTGFLPTLTFSAQETDKATVNLKFLGIPLKSIDVVCISNRLIVPSGQIVGISEENNSPQGGTITFYDKETGLYSALAHGLNHRDDTHSVNGKLFYAETGNVIKGENGTMGSISGNMYIDRQIGTVEKNTKYGIYGKVFDSFARSGHLPTQIALSDEVQLGKATFVSDVEGTGVKDYNGEIVGFEDGYFILHLTDDYLIEKTGGVVHGMSGTPVIQNNKIVGAISAGENDNPEKIYCIYIQDLVADFEKYEQN